MEIGILVSSDSKVGFSGPPLPDLRSGDDHLSLCYGSAWPGPHGSAPGSYSCQPRPCPIGPGGRRQILTAQVVFPHSICFAECPAVAAAAAASPTAACSWSPAPLHHLPTPATRCSGRHDFGSATSRLSARRNLRAVPRLLPPPPPGILGFVVRSRRHAAPRAWAVWRRSGPAPAAHKCLPCASRAGLALARLEKGLFLFFLSLQCS